MTDNIIVDKDCIVITLPTIQTCELLIKNKSNKPIIIINPSQTIKLES